MQCPPLMCRNPSKALSVIHPSGTWLGNGYKEVNRKQPNQTPETHQLTPFEVEEQQLHIELPLKTKLFDRSLRPGLNRIFISTTWVSLFWSWSISHDHR